RIRCDRRIHWFRSLAHVPAKPRPFSGCRLAPKNCKSMAVSKGSGPCLSCAVLPALAGTIAQLYAGKKWAAPEPSAGAGREPPSGAERYVGGTTSRCFDATFVGLARQRFYRRALDCGYISTRAGGERRHHPADDFPAPRSEQAARPDQRATA